MFTAPTHSQNQEIRLQALERFNIVLCLKREDQLHPLVSGNKFRKLKYNLLDAKEKGFSTLLTFGGAYSNHIAATAAAGKQYDINTVGIIRGEELANKYLENPTLRFASENGMRFEFVSRETYTSKDADEFQQYIKKKYDHPFILPEGGTNALAVKGCAEILTENDSLFDCICTAVGTGGTMAGLVQSATSRQHVLGYSALKGAFQSSEIEKYTSKTNFNIKDDYCFGGYAKIDSILVRFMNEFKTETDILLDPVYTAKMLFGIVEDIKKGFFPKNSRILAIHTGGLQGIPPMNNLLKRKNIPQIQT